MPKLIEGDTGRRWLVLSADEMLSHTAKFEEMNSDSDLDYMISFEEVSKKETTRTPEEGD